MNMHDTHPDSEQFDRLRAGLLDDEPRLKASLEAHLGGCATCQKRYDLAGHLRPGELPVNTASEQLDHLRRQALEATPAKHQRLLPIAMAAALALVAVVLVKPSLQENQPDTLMAQTSMEATPVLYEDLDFYLWMADYKDDDSASRM
ncbi:hypothetical protein MNBD_GAMMA15-1067 [hydrothermal vent metagenome]|uniref:Zinc-finger domain-containing protein n=1 Tax=hydrothermal vent metagenome TaxID=652676 RepID=A0A3B0YK36_9ZZZZ